MKLILFILTLTFCFFSHAQDKGNNLVLGVPKTDGQLVNRIGYAFSYSEKHEQPLFVTYELTKEEVENKVAKRKDNFRKDPLVTTGSAILDDYKRSGYDRGHLGLSYIKVQNVPQDLSLTFLSANTPLFKPI